MVDKLQGIQVSPGRAMGPVFFKDDDLDESAGHILAHLVEEEVARFERAVEAADSELRQLRSRHEEELDKDDIQILDVHRTYLRDPSFGESVVKLIGEELLRAESAIARVVSDFERVMELVEDRNLQERAEDLRDVGLRVLRCMRAERIEPEGAGPVEPTEPYILVARRLSIADMFALNKSRVLGILAEEGGVEGHAAILARSMRIPALTGVEELFDEIFPGDTVILDAEAAEVQVRPTERMVREFRESVLALRVESGPPVRQEAVTRDGERVVLVGSCGTLEDVELCVKYGLEGIGVYRTELSFLGQGTPTIDQAVAHYREVLKRAGEHPVTFRLLDTDLGALGLEGGDERNPALGLRSLRALLKNRELLRLQVRAFLRAAAGGELHVLVPFVTLKEDLRAVKEVIKEVVFEERGELDSVGGPGTPEVYLGLCIEVPAVALALGDILGEVDYAVVALDDLAQHLYAADRDSMAVRSWYRAMHPAMFRLLATIADTARQSGKAVGLFGESAANVQRLPFYIGAGYRSFSISPDRVPSFRSALATLTLERCRDITDQVLNLSSEKEIRALLTEQMK